GRNNAGRQTLVMFLDGVAKRQADAKPIGILAKFLQDPAMKGRVGFVGPAFHRNVIVTEFANIQPGSRKQTARFTVGQWRHNCKLPRKFVGAAQDMTALISINRLRYRAEMPTGKTSDL